jgi:cell division protein FtsL
MPAATRSRSRTHARSTVAPRGPRRVSGPVARRAVPTPAGGAALPRTTSVFARVRALPDHRVVDRLLRSRLWIWAVGLALGGIVTMQVSLLKLNSGISRAVETTTTLERQNADLEASIARLSSPDRIESGATTLGMLMPPAGDVAYLRAGPEDAAQAVKRMEPPSADAAALLQNGGIVPGSLAAAEVAPVVVPVEPVVTPQPVEPVEPVATAEPVAAAATAQPTASATAPAVSGQP